MPLLSKKEVLNLKLKSIPVNELKEFCRIYGYQDNIETSKIIETIISSNEALDDKINKFIKDKFSKRIEARRKLISDEDLKNELLNVQSFAWGVIQGQLDQKIQSQYVRKFFRYQDLIKNVRLKLHKDVTNYVICTWFNHWTTVLIEEHIGQHPKVIPTLKNIKGIDLFFDGQPFDLKVTYLPRGYNPDEAIKEPIKLARWFYENQGEQRFGFDNRIYIVLFDKSNPEKSWELKREFDFIFKNIDDFFNLEQITPDDEIVFSYKRNTYTTITKILLITK